ncbi:MAG: hypothetical protein ACP5IO_03905 [Elusimicrobiales bacterium]
MKIILVLSSLILSQTQCPNNRTSITTPCYGECGSFIDENSNGICDIWERYNAIKKKKPSLESKKTFQKPQNKVDQKKEFKKTSFSNRLFSNGVFYILFITILMSIASEIFFKNSKTIRIMWDWILLLSTLISALSGFILYFGFFEELRKFFYPLHIQSSSVFFIAAVYHTVKRFRYMI